MPVTILYNGVCPVCRAGACDLERKAIAAKAGVTFVDVAADPRLIEARGIPLEAVRLKLHAIDEAGRVLVGMPAVAIAWAATPPHRALGRAMKLPVLREIGAALYDVAARVLYAWNRACGRW